jgi:hypothetical protein
LIDPRGESFLVVLRFHAARLSYPSLSYPSLILLCFFACIYSYRITTTATTKTILCLCRVRVFAASTTSIRRTKRTASVLHLRCWGSRSDSLHPQTRGRHHYLYGMEWTLSFWFSVLTVRFSSYFRICSSTVMTTRPVDSPSGELTLAMSQEPQRASASPNTRYALLAWSYFTLIFGSSILTDRFCSYLQHCPDDATGGFARR